ncbi:MAG: hypothetical protein K0R57_2269 [Paenibacillaceae bacterium]|jgi:16S rRNA G966 N2-methylase RsmD|nr:hypothetical protein [Paenibacillaceae bacterium]
MFVTTSYHPASTELKLAKHMAARLGCPYVERRQSSLPRLLRIHGLQDILVVTTKGPRFFPQGADEPFFFHPSTAQIRLKRLLRGEADALLETAEIRPGEAILDCTAGLASESILLAYAAGPQGSVTAVESEPLVALLVEHGLAEYCSGVAEMDEAMRRITLACEDHLDYLGKLADNSMDIVYFDPMFRQTIEETSALAPLKTIANYGALRKEAVAEARRVARRRVILKENRDGDEFARLGFSRIYRPNTKIAYGVIDV